ncbi:hypothetical protein CCACVL1_27361, partial [Corchorus capsularis]
MALDFLMAALLGHLIAELAKVVNHRFQ